MARRNKKSINPMSLDVLLDGIPGGLLLVVSYIRRLSFKEEKYERWIRCYEDDPKRTLDEVCKLVEVDPSDLLGDVVAMAHRWGDQVVQLAASVIAQERAAEVIERSYTEAAKPDGFADRTRLLQTHGVHPAPKSSIINVNQGVALQGAGMRSFEDETSELAEILAGEPLQLDEGEQDYIEVAEREVEHEFVEVQE